MLELDFYEPSHAFKSKWTLANDLPLKNDYTAFSLRLGCGSTAMGYNLVGFRFQGGIESNNDLIDIFKAHLAGQYIYSELPTQLPCVLQDLDIVDCQATSTNADIIIKLKPRTFICFGNDNQFVEKIKRSFWYKTEYYTLNTSKMGIPCNKEYKIIIGVRNNLLNTKINLDFNESKVSNLCSLLEYFSFPLDFKGNKELVRNSIPPIFIAQIANQIKIQLLDKINLKKQELKNSMLGLIYKGSKRLISYDILQMIKRYSPSKNKIYDLFGGGGSMSLITAQNGFEVMYNELDPIVYNTMLYIKNYFNINDFKTFIDKETFKTIQNSSITPLNSALLMLYGFGGGYVTYSFSKENELTARLIFNVIMFNDKDSALELDKRANYKNKVSDFVLQNKTTNDFLSQYNSFIKYGQREYRSFLSRLKQYILMNEVLNNHNITLNNQSYDKVELDSPQKSILYLDPPYRGVSGYGSDFGKKTSFDYKQFDEWCVARAKEGYDVYVSEYKIDNPHFLEIFTKRKLCQMQRGGNGYGERERIERLYKVIVS